MCVPKMMPFSMDLLPMASAEYQRLHESEAPLCSKTLRGLGSLAVRMDMDIILQGTNTSLSGRMRRGQPYKALRGQCHSCHTTIPAHAGRES